MTYTVDPTNPLTPTDLDDASYAAAELRALKQLLANYTGGLSAINPTFRNRLVNADMRVDQRNWGAAQTFTAGVSAYCIDRWVGFCTGANVTGQQASGTLSPTKYRYTGAAGVTLIQHIQRIVSANVADLVGKVVTLAANLDNSLLTSATWRVYYANSVDNFSAMTAIASGTFTISSAEARYSAQITLPSQAANGVAVVFEVGAQTSGTFSIGNAQFEAGAVATPFEFKPAGVSLAQCQEYCWGTLGLLLGQAKTTSDLDCSILTNPVQMRANPVLSGSFTVSADNAGTPVLTTTRIVGVDGKKSNSIYNGSSNWTVGAWVSFNGFISAEV